MKKKNHLQSLVMSHGDRRHKNAAKAVFGHSKHLARKLQGANDKLNAALALVESLESQLATERKERLFSFAPADSEVVMVKASFGGQFPVAVPVESVRAFKIYTDIAEAHERDVLEWERSMFQLVGEDGIKSACDAVKALQLSLARAVHNSGMYSAKTFDRAINVLDDVLIDCGDSRQALQQALYAMGLQQSREG